MQTSALLTKLYINVLYRNRYSILYICLMEVQFFNNYKLNTINIRAIFFSMNIIILKHYLMPGGADVFMDGLVFLCLCRECKLIEQWRYFDVVLFNYRQVSHMQINRNAQKLEGSTIKHLFSVSVQWITCHLGYSPV